MKTPRDVLPIVERIAVPSPAEIRMARERAGLTQTQAALLVSSADSKPHRTWQNYEAPEGSRDHRPIRLAAWELFLLMTGQHPELSVVPRPYLQHPVPGTFGARECEPAQPS